MATDTGLNGTGVAVAVVNVLVKSVRSDEGHMSYPVSLEEMGVWSPIVPAGSVKLPLPLPGLLGVGLPLPV